MVRLIDLNVWDVSVAVVFGELIEGMGVLRRIELCGSKSGKPKKRVVIGKCGEVWPCL